MEDTGIFDNFYVSQVVEVDRTSVLQEGMAFFGLDEWKPTGPGITCMTRTCLIQIWHLMDYEYFSDGGTTSLYERYLAFASPVTGAAITTGTAMTGQWLLCIDCIAGGAVGRASSYRSWVTSHRSIWEVLFSIELTGDDTLPYEEGSTISSAGVTMPLDPFLLYESQGIRPLVENISSGGWGVTLDNMRFAISIEEFSSLREIDDSLYDLVAYDSPLGVDDGSGDAIISSFLEQAFGGEWESIDYPVLADGVMFNVYHQVVTDRGLEGYGAVIPTENGTTKVIYLLCDESDQGSSYFIGTLPMLIRLE